jgi:acyl-coenzyme A synthetase/AMP-(fatty) acid ligase
MRDAAFSRVDTTTAPPTVDVPPVYNAAVDLVDRRVLEGDADRAAIIDDFGTTSYGALAERTARVAALLGQLGVTEEQRVLLCVSELPKTATGKIQRYRLRG